MCQMESSSPTSQSLKLCGRDYSSADPKLPNSPNRHGKLHEVSAGQMNNFGLKKAIYIPIKHSSFGIVKTYAYLSIFLNQAFHSSFK